MSYGLTGYYNRVKNKPSTGATDWEHIEEILIRSGHSVQSAEINELQTREKQRLKKLCDALFSNGQVLGGCGVTVDAQNQQLQMDSGIIYFEGQVRDVPAATLNFDVTGTVLVGVVLNETVVTENEDANLRNPALGSPDYNKAGAARLVVTVRWLTSDQAETERGELVRLSSERTLTETELLKLTDLEKFCAIYTISEGACVKAGITTTGSEENSNIVANTIAQYDRESHGSYVTEGLSVRAMPSGQAGTQLFSIASGHAHIDGYEISLAHSKNLAVTDDVDTRVIESEPHNFIPEANNTMRINLNYAPLDSVNRVLVTFEVTESVTHGSYSGCMDNLAHTSLNKIVSVKQGETTYTQGTDYKLTLDKVDWALSGEEPAPGSSYIVTYQYSTYINPTGVDTTGFSLTGVVPDTTIYVDYTYRLPRKDLIVMYRDGSLARVKGVSHSYAPVAPETPPNSICLAIVTQNWTGLPVVENVAVQAIGMSQLKQMAETINTLKSALATLQLQTDVIASTPSSKYGIFVDPFFDDDMRDLGIEQDAVIAYNSLTIPIVTQDTAFSFNQPQTLDYTPEVVLEQLARTGSMQINPYQAFAPLPIKLAINPSVDHWTREANIDLGTQTVTIDKVVYAPAHPQHGQTLTSTTANTALLASGTGEDQNLRVRDVQITASGLGPNEIFDVFFDGHKVITHGVADSDGNVDQTFTIPEGLSAGVKLVELRGGASNGEATYVGTGSVTTNLIKTTEYITRTLIDPLAQTFVLDESRHITGVNVWFTRKGTAKVRAQIRETLIGYPTDIVLAQGDITADDITENAVTQINFDSPVFLNAGTMYAIVILTDTSDHELAIGELTKFDEASQKWVTSQPYPVGTLLSSSNATAWTIHQTADLWFQLIAANFTNTTRVVTLGNVEMTDVTDLLPMAEVETTGAGTDVTFIFEDSQGNEAARGQAGQALALSEKLNGTYTVKAEFTGSDNKCSPVLYGGVQLLTGALANSGSYFSRAFSCGAAKKIHITLDVYAPGSSRVDVAVQTAVNTYTDATPISTTPIGNGWQTVLYECPCALAQTRVKISMAGSPSERPYCQNLRAVVLDA